MAIDFKALKEKQRAAEVNLTAESRATFLLINNLTDCDITPWEKSFLASLYSQVKYRVGFIISPKQQAILDKLKDKHLPDSDDNYPDDST